MNILDELMRSRIDFTISSCYDTLFDTYKHGEQQAKPSYFDVAISVDEAKVLTENCADMEAVESWLKLQALEHFPHSMFADMVKQKPEKVTIEITADEYSVECNLTDGFSHKEIHTLGSAGNSEPITELVSAELNKIEAESLYGLADSLDELSFGPFGIAQALFERRDDLIQ